MQTTRIDGNPVGDVLVVFPGCDVAVIETDDGNHVFFRPCAKSALVFGLDGICDNQFLVGGACSGNIQRNIRRILGNEEGLGKKDTGLVQSRVVVCCCSSGGILLNEVENELICGSVVVAGSEVGMIGSPLFSRGNFGDLGEGTLVVDVEDIDIGDLDLDCVDIGILVTYRAELESNLAESVVEDSGNTGEASLGIGVVGNESAVAARFAYIRSILVSATIV